MSDYNPDLVGKIVISSRGKMVAVRKYHMTREEIVKAKKRFEELTKKVSKRIKNKAGAKFFNPYRSRGVYFAQIQALYLLGANEWHSYNEVRDKMREFASSMEIMRREGSCIRKTNVWAEFERKTSKPDSVTSKDLFGRINENMVFFQRLSKLHPYGYKLRQACAAVDIKRVSKKGFPNGVFYYRLSTYKSFKKAIPIKDPTNFVSTKRHGRKYGSCNKDTPIIVTGKNVVAPHIKQVEKEKVR